MILKSENMQGKSEILFFGCWTQKCQTELQTVGAYPYLERLDKLERHGEIRAFDKRTIIEFSGDVIKEIAQKYKNVQEGIGDMMSGALIETEARKILNQGISETKRNAALNMLKRGKLTVQEIAEDLGLSVAEVELLAGLQSV